MTVTKQRIKTVLRFFVGLFLCALSIVMSINANLGLGPWNAFHMGLSMITTITFGNAQIIVGLVIILIGISMKQVPGWGTIINMYFVGTFVDIINKSGLVPQGDALLPKLFMLLGGMVMLGLGTYLYMSAQLGAGPRDGVMVALVKRTGKPVWLIRNMIEGFALITGILMGAPIGAGTVIYTVGIGYAIQGVFNLFRFDAKKCKNRTIVDDYIFLKEAVFAKEKG